MKIKLGKLYRVPHCGYVGKAMAVTKHYLAGKTVVLQRSAEDGSAHAWEVPIRQIERVYSPNED